MLSKAKRSFMVRNISAFYLSGDYDVVLKYLKMPYELKRRDEVLCNVIRIFALKKTNRNQWVDEYNYLLDQCFLDVFNDDEKKYISLHLEFELHGNSIVNLGIAEKNISKRVKKLFETRKV